MLKNRGINLKTPILQYFWNCYDNINIVQGDISTPQYKHIPLQIKIAR